MKSFKVDAKLTETTDVSIYVDAENEADAIWAVKNNKFDTLYKTEKIRYNNGRNITLENLSIDHDHTEELANCLFCNTRAYKRLFPEEYKGKPVCPSCVCEKDMIMKKEVS